jgi:DNA uptake protein ComE-like DNA-binding protein
MTRRGTILLSVLVVMVIAALVGASAMYSASAQASTASLTLRRTQARALAWSGVQAVMTELAGQRDALLDGETPTVTEEWELFTDRGSRGVIRLLPIEGEEVVQSEAARLNLNTATAEMLKALGASESAAAAVIAARDSAPLQSVESILALPGISAADLRQQTGAESESKAESGSDLLSLFTVWSFDPNIQSGIGPEASAHRGKLRINLDTPWSDRLKGAIEDRFGEGSSEALKRLMDEGAKFKSTADVVAQLQKLNVDAVAWPPILDALTTSEDPYLPGKIDINTAPAEVIACIPGFDAEAARQVVEHRATLDAAAKRSINWPLTEGLLKSEQFSRAADHLTTRSMQWRVRVEAGIAPPDEGDTSAKSATLRDRIALEAIIDVASERPRVAYLRDITMQGSAAALYETLLASGDEPPPEADDPPEPSDSGDPASAARAEQPENSAPAAASGRSTASDNDLSFDSWGSGDLSPIDPELAPVGPSELERLLEAEEPEPPAGIDRRLGRWRTGKGTAP